MGGGGEAKGGEGSGDGSVGGGGSGRDRGGARAGDRGWAPTEVRFGGLEVQQGGEGAHVEGPAVEHRRAPSRARADGRHRRRYARARGRSSAPRGGSFAAVANAGPEDPTDRGVDRPDKTLVARSSSFREPQPGSLKKSTRRISIPDLVWALFLRTRAASSGREIPGFGFWRCARGLLRLAGRVNLNRADHHARRAGDLDSVARPRVRDASQEEGR